MVDRCPFLEYKSRFFGPSWYCKKAEKDIYDGEALYKEYCAAGERYYSQCPDFAPQNSSSGGCYLTSACTEAMGLADDCHELTVLRNFRDSWLAAQPGGQAEIDAYYQLAPAIVASIQRRSEHQQILCDIYRELVTPCVRLITEKKFSEAHDLYRAKALELKERYLN